MKKLLVLATLVMIVLSACGSPAPAPAAVPTAAPPTEVPPTAVPPTEVPPTPTPAPTSIPGEIATADQLGLGIEFVALSKDDLSKKVPALLLPVAGLETPNDDPLQVKWSQYPTKAGFAFANNDNTKFVYGYIVDLPESKDQSAFDASFIGEFYAKMRLTTYPPDVSKIKDITVGEKSVGITAKYKVENTIWRLNAVVFRIGSVGAFTFTLFVEDAGSPIEIGKLAQLYADKIK